MNQAQRNFLIEKIEESTKQKIEAFKDSLPQKPSLETFILHKVLSNDFEIKTTAELKAMIIEMALNAKDREDWAGNSWHRANKTEINFKMDSFFILPEEYSIRKEQYDKDYRKIQEQINTIQTQADTLIVRIKLASNRILETLISDIDDMGNISLMDTRIKALTK